MANKILRRSQFGNPILRTKTRALTSEEILEAEIKRFISDMKFTLKKKSYGVGLAANQVGRGVAIAVIDIKPTKLRPDLPKSKWLKLVMINPKVVKTFGNKTQLWEGCISLSDVFAKVPRYKKVRVAYMDEKTQKNQKTFDKLAAHVVQHEIDHLAGILFVDKVKDPRTYMSLAEYKKRIINKKKK